MNNLKSNILRIYDSGFRQVHNAMCGPASIILATQSLGFAAKKEIEWSAPKYSRWMPVEDFVERGIALHELQFISELIYDNQIEIHLKRAYPENFSLFAADVETFHQAQNTVLIVNFRQDDFVKTTYCEDGNPHHSPIADWNSAKKELLIADVDSLIEKPYWVTIEAMFASMAHYHPAYGIPRGWLVLKKRQTY